MACGSGHAKLSKSYMDMASKLFTFTVTFTKQPWLALVKSSSPAQYIAAMAHIYIY